MNAYAFVNGSSAFGVSVVVVDDSGAVLAHERFADAEEAQRSLKATPPSHLDGAAIEWVDAPDRHAACMAALAKAGA